MRPGFGHLPTRAPVATGKDNGQTFPNLLSLGGSLGYGLDVVHRIFVSRLFACSLRLRLLQPATVCHPDTRRGHTRARTAATISSYAPSHTSTPHHLTHYHHTAFISAAHPPTSLPPPLPPHPHSLPSHTYAPPLPAHTTLFHTLRPLGRRWISPLRTPTGLVAARHCACLQRAARAFHPLLKQAACCTLYFTSTPRSLATLLASTLRRARTYNILHLLHTHTHHPHLPCPPPATCHAHHTPHHTHTAHATHTTHIMPRTHYPSLQLHLPIHTLQLPSSLYPSTGTLP